MGLDRDAAQGLQDEKAKGGPFLNALDMKKVSKKEERMERAVKRQNVEQLLASEFG